MNWEQLLEAKHAMEQEAKARAMIYQVEAKEEAARAFGRPWNHFHHWPYRHWCKVSEMFVRKRKRVENECRALGIPGSMPWIQHPHYRKEMGY